MSKVEQGAQDPSMEQFSSPDTPADPPQKKEMSRSEARKRRIMTVDILDERIDAAAAEIGEDKANELSELLYQRGGDHENAKQTIMEVLGITDEELNAQIDAICEAEGKEKQKLLEDIARSNEQTMQEITRRAMDASPKVQKKALEFVQKIEHAKEEYADETLRYALEDFQLVLTDSENDTADEMQRRSYVAGRYAEWTDDDIKEIYNVLSGYTIE